MKATNKTEATKEGKNFAGLLGALVVKQQNVDFEHVADFAQILAVDVFGYGGAELANAWTRGFISEWTNTKTGSTGGEPTDEQLGAYFRKMLSQTPLLQEKNGE